MSFDELERSWSDHPSPRHLELCSQGMCPHAQREVRDFKVEDTSPYAINLGWMGSSADAEASKDEEDGRFREMRWKARLKYCRQFFAALLLHFAMWFGSALTIIQKGCMCTLPEGAGHRTGKAVAQRQAYV
eukprot:4595541-Amphidinium_carterae.2